MLCLFLALCSLIFLSLCLPLPSADSLDRVCPTGRPFSAHHAHHFLSSSPPPVCFHHLLWPVTAPHKRLLFAFASCLWPDADRIHREPLYRCRGRSEGSCCHTFQCMFILHLKTQLCRDEASHTEGLTRLASHLKGNLFYYSCCLNDLLTDGISVDVC